RNRQLIAVLELLSPSNKRPGADREQYLTKRAELIASSAHLVELDLLPGGPRLPLTNLPECDYYALVSRVEDRPSAGLWPIQWTRRLPPVPIPLRANAPEVKLDLHDILHQVSDQAHHPTYIYAGHPEPPLSPTAAAWAQQFLPAAT